MHTRRLLVERADDVALSPMSHCNMIIHDLCLAIYVQYIYIWSRPPAGYPPPWYGPGRSIEPGTWHAFTAPSLGYLPPFLPLFPHLIEFLANTIGFYTICKDYDSINQHSHPSTTTPPTPTGGEAGNHDHPGGGGGWGSPRAVPYIHVTYFAFEAFTLGTSSLLLPGRQRFNPMTWKCGAIYFAATFTGLLTGLELACRPVADTPSGLEIGAVTILAVEVGSETLKFIIAHYNKEVKHILINNVIKNNREDNK